MSKSYNFLLDYFFVWNQLSKKKICFSFLNFEIQNFQTASYGKTTKTKVTVLDDICNFLVRIIFHLNLFMVPNIDFKIL